MNIRETQQQIENQIAQSIDSVEGLHRLSAGSLFEQLGQVAPIASFVQSIRPVYENGAAQAFEIGRNLNRTGGEVARALIDRMGI